MNENNDLEIIEDLEVVPKVEDNSNITKNNTETVVENISLEDNSIPTQAAVEDVNAEIIEIDENTKKPEIMKEQVITKKEQEKKQSKASMTLVIVILLILILVVLFLPQISELLS